MKFAVFLAVIAITIAIAYCAEGIYDPRCPPYDPPNTKPTYLPHESDCTKYWMCSNGKRYEKICPPMETGERLHWDQKNEYCNWPYAANCQV
uniref:CSON015613 protein n=1 Tax=Culicoides sonorensis TaxID=179676 RepID=A0A336LPX3_CULSO